MNQIILKTRRSYFMILFFLFTSIIFSQDVFEILVDSSEYRTDILTETGRNLKFIESGEKLIVLDYENYRILFFQKGTNFDDHQIIKIVGQHSRVQKDQPFDPLSYNRLSQNFRGTIFNDNLWITNYPYGEILQFDLNGNYLNTISGKYQILETNDSTLYAFEDRSIYYYSPSENNFIYLKDLPESISIENSNYKTNVKIGSNRMCIKNDDSLHVYDFIDYIQNNSVSRLFSKTGEDIPDFEIMTDEIIWATSRNGNYKCCDLDGNDTKSGSFNEYTYTYNFTNNLLYYVSAWKLKIFDVNLTELVSERRFPFYVKLDFLGADSSNLYFQNRRNVRFSITPLDRNQNIFYYSPNNEIDEGNAMNREIRILDNYIFQLSEWPSDSFNIYVFNIDQMSKTFFEVGKVQGFDVVGDTIYTISGKNLKVYSRDGSFLNSYELSNLSNSNLQDVDSNSNIIFAANNSKFFIGYNDKINIFDNRGAFLEMYDFPIDEPAHLFASNTLVICNNPIKSLEISTGDVSDYMPKHTTRRGFIFKNLYWYNSGVNSYASINSDLVEVKNIKRDSPKNYILIQNYPNPFNPSTKIQFGLPKESKVTLTVYNVLGEKVTELVNQQLKTGYHEVEFNGRDLASGIYFYRLQADDNIDTKKMILIK